MLYMWQIRGKLEHRFNRELWSPQNTQCLNTMLSLHECHLELLHFNYSSKSWISSEYKWKVWMTKIKSPSNLIIFSSREHINKHKFVWMGIWVILGFANPWNSHTLYTVLFFILSLKHRYPLITSCHLTKIDSNQK